MLKIQLMNLEEKGYLFAFAGVNFDLAIGIEALTNGKGFFFAELEEEQAKDFYKNLGKMLEVCNE